MIKNILFDLDGTLANTALDLANALNAVRLSCELPELPIDIIRPTVSLGANAMIKLGFGFEEGHPELEEIRRKFLHLYSKNIAQETHLYEGMEEVLKKFECTKKEQMGLRVWAASARPPLRPPRLRARAPPGPRRAAPRVASTGAARIGCGSSNHRPLASSNSSSGAICSPSCSENS